MRRTLLILGFVISMLPVFAWQPSHGTTPVQLTVRLGTGHHERGYGYRHRRCRDRVVVQRVVGRFGRVYLVRRTVRECRPS